MTQTIHCEDCLDVLLRFPSASINLIYIDPPFIGAEDITNSKPNHIINTESIYDYSEWLLPRIIELHRILKDDGSIYLQCDSSTDAYIKILLDKIFGIENFNSRIIWKRNSLPNNFSEKKYRNNYDSIYIYNKSNNYKFNYQYAEFDTKYIDSAYKYLEPDTGRRFALNDLTSSLKNSRPGLTYEFLGIERNWRISQEQMMRMHEEGRIYQSRPGSIPSLKRYLDEQKGTAIDSIWTDTTIDQPRAKTETYYTSQKPLSLLERIIKTSSDEGDVVLDAFCGSGTTLHAAQLLGRQWIGIDSSKSACQFSAEGLKIFLGLEAGKDFHILPAQSF